MSSHKNKKKEGKTGEPKEYLDSKILMPVGFVGHGAPTLAVEDNEITQAWKAWGESLLDPEEGREARPKAVLVISAHWVQWPPHLGPLSEVPLNYDFYGFPGELYDLEYNAPTAPLLAKLIMGLLENIGLKPATLSDRGLDHGAWVPLLHLFPRAGIPVLQVSIPTGASFSEYMALGKALASLRSKGVFILGSGNITHNLGLVDFSDRAAAPPDWVSGFDNWVKETLLRFDLKTLSNYMEAPGGPQSHPTDEHFTPLLVAAASAGTRGKPKVRFPFEGFDYGMLSMRCVEFR